MLKFWIDAAVLGIEAQQVMWLRAMRIAGGGKRGHREARLMVSEKVAATVQAAGAVATGAHPEKVVQSIRSKVRANKRRLSR